MIYIVYGNNGLDYEYYDEWEVAAYTNEVEANKHAKLANEAEDGKKNPYDNRYKYQNVSYKVTSLKVYDSLYQYIGKYRVIVASPDYLIGYGPNDIEFTEQIARLINEED